MNPILEKLRSRSVRTAGGCLVWLGARRRGYGAIRHDGRVWYVHRLAEHVRNGPIPPGVSVLHSCDNPPCWEATHLSRGTQADNLADMARKGRAARNAGKSNGKTRLDDAAVSAIRDRRAAGESRAAIASEYGVGRRYITAITSGERRRVR